MKPQVIEDAVGQPIKGKPDCYGVNPSAEKLPYGAKIYPQGEQGPCFVKERYTDPFLGVEIGLWRHVDGQPAKLKI